MTATTAADVHGGGRDDLLLQHVRTLSLLRFFRDDGQRLNSTLLPKADAGVANFSMLGSRLPQYELSIRRLHARDEEFRAVCEEFEVALNALHHWESLDPDPSARVDQYRELLREIESDIVVRIDQAEKSGSGQAEK